MDPAPTFDDFVPQGLAALGVRAGEDELAVMRATHELFWPAFTGLLELDLTGVEPEDRPDLSRAPAAA